MNQIFGVKLQLIFEIHIQIKQNRGGGNIAESFSTKNFGDIGKFGNISTFGNMGTQIKLFVQKFKKKRRRSK
jgi:hypothetical protein